MHLNMAVKYVDIEYLRAQNTNPGQLLLTGQSNTVTKTQAIVVDSNGNVGIGTSESSDTLVVNGNIRLADINSSIILADGSLLESANQFKPVGDPGTIQFAGNNSLPSGDSQNLFWDTGNLRLGIGTNTPVSTLQVNFTSIESKETVFTGTSPTVVDSFIATNVRSASYFVQITDVTNTEYHTSQITVVQNGTTAWKSEYGIVVSNERLGVFDCFVNNGNLELIFTAFLNTSKTAKITRISMTA